MGYSKLSNAEINQAVTCALNPETRKMALIGDGSCFYDCGPDGSQFYEIPIHDYCNNAADAWPIIVANRITLMPASKGDKWMAQAFDYAIADVSINPLRSAMIVFLMMQESQ